MAVGFFAISLVRPAMAQSTGGSAQVSDQCHVTSRCKITGVTCTADTDCKTSGDKCAFTAVRMNYHIPGVTELISDASGVKHPYVQSMACFIADIYRYLSGVAGILAVTMMIYGGIKYTVSFGNPSKLQDARDTITSAMIGLALVLGTYVILNFINPGLTSLKVTGLDPIIGKDYSGYKVTKMCDASRVNERNADGTPIECGKKKPMYPDDPDEAKSNQVCLGFYCNRELLGEFTYCSLWGETEESALVSTDGKCMTDEKLQGVHEEEQNNPDAKKEVISTSGDGDLVMVNIASCGTLTKAIDLLHDTGLDYYLGTNCDDDETCVGININPVIIVDPGPLAFAHDDAENFFCKNTKEEW